MSRHKPHPQERYFRYLTRLSREGRSNMYGAVPYLAAAFALDRDTAFRIVCEWVDAQAAARAAEQSLTLAGRPPSPVSGPMQPAPAPAGTEAGATSPPPEKAPAARRKVAGVGRKPSGLKRRRPGVRRAA